MSVRTYLNENLRPLLPAEWVFYDYDKTLGEIGKVTAVLVHQNVVPAERDTLLHTVRLLIFYPTKDEQKAENRLDDLLEDLIPQMQAVSRLDFRTASKGSRDGSPCWDIELQIKTTT